MNNKSGRQKRQRERKERVQCGTAGSELLSVCARYSGSKRRVAAQTAGRVGGPSRDDVTRLPHLATGHAARLFFPCCRRRRILEGNRLCRRPDPNRVLLYSCCYYPIPINLQYNIDAGTRVIFFLVRRYQ